MGHIEYGPWVRCPEMHTPEEALERGLPQVGHGYDRQFAQSVGLRMLAEGFCPACPGERITMTPHIDDRGRYSRALRCACCEAAWEYDRQTYWYASPGRLRAVTASEIAEDYRAHGGLDEPA